MTDFTGQHEFEILQYKVTKGGDNNGVDVVAVVLVLGVD